MLYHIMIIILLSICCIDAATVWFDPNTYNVTEEDTNITVTISLVTSEALSADSTVRISSVTTDGATNQATAGVDYMSFNDTVTIPAGSTSYNYTVTIFSNPEAELSEVFSVSVEFVSGNQLTVNGSNALITINDTDVPTVMFDPVTYNITEGDTLRISFVTSQPLLGPSIVRLYDIPTAGATNQATPGSDYTSFNETITLYAGSNAIRYDYTRSIYRNYRAEFPEQFSAALEFVSGWPLTVTGSNATINIIDIDVPTIGFSKRHIDINSQETINATVTLIGVTSLPLLGDTIIRLTDVPTNKPATRNVDYIGFNVEITLPAGSTGFSYNVTILSSPVLEFTEYFNANMSYVSGAPLSVTGSVVTITIYDTSVILLTFTSPEYIVSENNGSVTVTVTSSSPVLTDTIIRLTDEPTSGGARNVTDYKSFSDTITIPRGQSSASYSISLVDDTVPESTESFDVRINWANGYHVASYSIAVVTIIDNDSTGSIDVALVISGLSIFFIIILIIILVAVILYLRKLKKLITSINKPPVVTTEASNMVYDKNISYQLHKITNEAGVYEDVLH